MAPQAVVSHKNLRFPATKLPQDERHNSIVELRHKIDIVVRTASQVAVIVPIVLGVGGGLIAVNVGIGSPAIQEGLIVGGLISGLFTYGQAIAESVRERRQLQIQLAAGSDLSLADLAGVDLSRSYLRERNLQGARLSKAVGYEADFSYADLRDARLTRGLFTRADFDHADLTGAGCYEAVLTRCSFRKTNLQGASMCGADVRHSDLRDADLRNADLRRARLEDCKLDNAQLAGAWYSHSTTWPANFDAEENRHHLLFKDDSTTEY